MIVIVTPTSASEADVAPRAKLTPLVEEKIARDGKATAYVCERRICQLPTSDPAVFAKQLRAARRLRPQ